jgi:DNA repair exonuclease SbcCD ATPase subunit
MEHLKLDQCLSDEGECLEDTFRPSLFRRIDSDSSIQSYDFPAPSIIDPNLSNIIQVDLSKQFQAEPRWDQSSLIFKPENKALELQDKISSFELESLTRKSKYTKDQLQEAINKSILTQEQFFMEADYFKTKIKYLEQKTQELNEKCASLESKNEELSKDVLNKDKKIIWLENEIFVKESKIKALVELEEDASQMRRFKESSEILKEKVQICENQIAALRKEKKEISSGFNVEIAKINEDKEKCLKDFNAVSKKLDRLQDTVKASNEMIKDLSKERDELMAKVKFADGGKDRALIRSVMNLVKVENEIDILVKVEELQKIKNYSKLVQKILRLVTDCSPPGTFPVPPSTTYVWKFIRKVMETYMDLSKKITTYEKFINQVSSCQSIDKLKTILPSSTPN